MYTATGSQSRAAAERKFHGLLIKLIYAKVNTHTINASQHTDTPPPAANHVPLLSASLMGFQSSWIADPMCQMPRVLACPFVRRASMTKSHGTQVCAFEWFVADRM